jgi:hypothetical protein
MKYIGKIGEFLVLSELLKRDIEAYQAIKSNQESYDISVILSRNNVARLQVKTTELNNKSTNNSIGNIDKEYDFLVIVVLSDRVKFYILSKSQALTEKGKNVKLSITTKNGNSFSVTKNLLCYENCWSTLINYGG